MKASTDIRLNKKGLTQGQWIKKHDDLTKVLKEWEMGGKKALPKETKEFFEFTRIRSAISNHSVLSKLFCSYHC